MADFTAPASDAGSVQEGSFPVKAAIVLALAALADWLFYGHDIQISVAIFAVAVACGALLANLATLNRKQVPLAGLLLLIALIPAIEEFNVASSDPSWCWLSASGLAADDQSRIGIVSAS